MELCSISTLSYIINIYFNDQYLQKQGSPEVKSPDLCGIDNLIVD